MNVKVEDVNSIKKKLTFEVAAEQVDAEIARAFSKIARTAKVKGFRAGKVPRSVLEKHYEDQMQQEVLTRLINETYFKALDSHKIPAVSDPSIVDASGIIRGEAFTYAAEVDVKPEVVARDYTGIALEKEQLVEDPAVVATRLEEMRSSRAQIEVSKREESRTGDLVQIDFEGFVDGQRFAGGSGENFELELGSASFIPGFEDQIVGMQRGDQKEIEVTFPDNYGEQTLAGKPAVFKVTLGEIKEKVLPELDDDFAREFGVESLEELRTELAVSHRSRETSRVEGDLREKLAVALIERNPIEVPEALVDSQLDYMYENISKRMQAQGMSPEMLGMSADRFKSQYRMTALAQVQGRLIMEAVGRQEQIVAEEADVDAKLVEVAEMANAPLEMVKKYYAGEQARQSLMAQITEEKVVRFLLDNSVIRDVPAAELTKEDDV